MAIYPGYANWLQPVGDERARAGAGDEGDLGAGRRYDVMPITHITPLFTLIRTLGPGPLWTMRRADKRPMSPSVESSAGRTEMQQPITSSTLWYQYSITGFVTYSQYITRRP